VLNIVTVTNKNISNVQTSKLRQYTRKLIHLSYAICKYLYTGVYIFIRRLGRTNRQVNNQPENGKETEKKYLSNK